MKRLISYSPFALMLALVLALGALAASMVSADVAGVTGSADPTTPGAVSQYRVTFTTPSALAANVDQIVIRFDKDNSVPSTIDKSRVVVSANDIVGGGCTITSGGGATACSAGQAVPMGQDPVVEIVEGGEGERDVKIILPDMDPATTGVGVGVQNIAAGALVTVTISSGGGIKNPTEGGTQNHLVRTSVDATFVPVPGIAIPRPLTLAAIDGGRGSSTSVTGKGFKDGTTATVWIDTDNNGTRNGAEIDIATAIVGSDDTFTANFTVTVPPFAPGANNVRAVDGRNNVATAPVVFTVLGSIEVTPKSAALGDTLTITLKDFPASTALPANAANIAGVILPIPGTVYPPTGAPVPGAVPTTNVNGEVTFATVVPNGVPSGTQALQFNNFGPSTRRTNMTIKGATITLTPDEVVPNQTLTLIGNGFTTASIQANVVIGAITIDGAAIPANKVNEGNPVSVDAGGNWSTSVIVPITTSTTTTGSHELKVVDTCAPPAPAVCNAGRDGTVNLKIKPRVLTLDPAVSRLGTRVSVNGTGFPAANTKAGADADSTVRVEYGIPGNPINVATLTPDASGNIGGSFSVPLSASIPSTNTVTAFFNAGATVVTTTVTHSVPRASVTITPSTGAPGTVVEVAVAGFKNFTTVQNMTIGNIDVRPSPVPATGASGDFTTTITIPQLEVGTHTVEVRVGGTTASTSFNLTSGVSPTPGPGQGSVAVDTALTPLGDNLVRVWGFDGSAFMLYDPNAALLSDLETLERGSGYWVNVTSAQSVTLGAGTYNLRAGWNLIGWLG